MFINAEPRYVSNGYGFDSFVPNLRAESLYRYRKFLEMANNDTNAWSVYRTADSSLNDTWNGYLDCYDSDENYPTGNSLYGEYFQNPASVSQNQVSCTSTPQRSFAFQDSSSSMDCYEQPSPMLGHDYAQMSLDRRQGSFAEFSNARNVLQDFKYHPTTESAPSSLTSTMSSVSASSFIDDTSTYGKSIDTNRISPEVFSCYSPPTKPASSFSSSFSSQVNPEVFSCYSPPTNPASSRFPKSSSSQHVQQAETSGNWSLGIIRDVKGPIQTPCDFNMSFDSLPTYPTAQQKPRDSRPLSTISIPTNKWASQSDEQHKTISPKVLTLNASSTSVASSGSGPVPVMKMSLSNITTSDNPKQLVVDPQQSVSRPRQILPSAPNKRSSSQIVIPVLRSTPPVKILPSMPLPTKTSSSRTRSSVLPSKEINAGRSSRKRSIKAIEPESHARRSSPPSKLAPHTSSRVQRTKVISKAPTPQKTVIKLTMPQKSTSSPEDFAVIKKAEHHRDSGDDFLVRSRIAGMSYKDIQEQGRYTEAISTLRGRYRTLTKNKAARVRRPEWSDKDVGLLKKAVQKFAKGDPAVGKIPWAKVASYIADNGGSYHFGNSTCHKRWDMLLDDIEQNEATRNRHRR